MRIRKGLAVLVIAALIGTSAGGMRVSAQEEEVSVQEETQTTENTDSDETDVSNENRQEGTSEEASDERKEGASSESSLQEEQNAADLEEDTPENTEAKEPAEQAETDEVTAMANTASVSYEVHSQTYGWLPKVKDGAESGTTGKAKRVESLKISVDSNVQGGIEYRAFIEGVGWTAWGADGAEVGTTGQAKRLEAFQVRLTGELANQYDVYYCTHAQTYGWLDWASNGATSGTIGFDKRLECVKIVLVEKGGKAPGATKTAKYVQDTVSYSTHVQSYGWLSEVKNGETSGTTGKSKRVESLKIALKSEMEGGIQFRGYVEGQGWTDWKDNYQAVGTTGQAKRLEAVEIKLTGEIAEKYDIYYRSHAQTYGWLDWAKNGDTSGTVGYDKRLEAVQIRLVAKGGAAPGTTKTPNHILKGITYSAYVEGQGWKTAENGAECGTTGQARRMESLKISVVDTGYTGGVSYSAYVQSYGWQNEASNGGTTGTANSGKRMEAIKIKLTGEVANHYDVYYQVHVQSIGWLDWAKNGEVAGTYNNSKRIESIRVQLVEKGKAAPGATTTPSYAYNLTTSAYVQGRGWVSAGNGVICGTTGQSKQIEALKIAMSDDRYSGSIQYQTYTEESGWSSAAGNGSVAGTANSGKRMEAIKIQLTGDLAEKYHIYYRVHVQSYGWLGWAADGTPAGTSNMSRRIEAVQIKMVPKVLAAPGTLRDSYISDIYGVDVSSYNGQILWSSVRNAGTEFAMLRITTRNLNKDTTFETNYNGAVANGIRVGVYKYGYATTVEEAKAEAQSVIKALNGRKLSFPVAYDVEDAVQQVLSKSQLNAIIDAFKAEIENAGYDFMLYTNLNWLNNVLDTQHFANEDIWIARYRSYALGHGYTGPGNVTIWQYTSIGTVPGISGNVDRNVAYKLY